MGHRLAAAARLTPFPPPGLELPHMCCFAFPTPTSLLARMLVRPIRVHNTQIFARLDGPQQLVAYAMNLRARSEVAMILPLPVRPGADEADLHFIDLSAAPDLFDLLHLAFMPPPMPAAKGGFMPQGISRSRQTLIVRQVGAFEASFVPSIADFDRLDPRFRLPDAVWSELPVHDFGFAVFKLRETGCDARIHPMAFRFPTRDPARIFFPTLHIHDGKAHSHARFDHSLYYQRSDSSVDPDHARPLFTELVTRAAERSNGLVHREWPLARATLTGRRANADTWFTASGSAA